MTAFERRCALDLADGVQDAFPIVHVIWQLKPKNRYEVVKYLLSSGITGYNLINLYKNLDASNVNIYNFVLKKTKGLMHRPLLKKDLI